ncbi:Cobalt-zinc-cadmium resistance protein CzcA [Labilithrix luteola]|uniref:Cobalt-zinc-cadmium resistance protein CzcA n=1 Tax=Labilithrix luteola TaxID=1391654 RepID=A0A0K1PTG3_9BACT|nr:efflux RND transporter permease subunit [Labilithrix luteola]AKU96424.1 Cobalt-zinc-cadmium resistance protein CzcA [Labilithrix luteola]
MIEKIVRFVLKAPAFAVLLALGLVGIGSYSYSELNIEAYPNPVPPLVEVIAQPPGWSAEETERYVTIPLEVGLAGMPGLDHTRSQSLFGLSDVKCYFKWGTKYEDARQEVINRLQFVTLPQGVQATISPWNAIGEVVRYTVEGKGYTVQQLKTAQDWILEKQFKQVPGVVDVVSFGGETKQFHIGVDPYRLKGHGVTLQQVIDAVQNANVNSGGQRLEMGEQSYDIRGIGLLRDVHDIEDIVIVGIKGTPVRVRDVADVKIGPAPRLGQVGIDERPDVVQGTILMRYGAETKPTLDGIHAKIEYIRANHILPPGMEVKTYYDRGDLVELTTSTVMENVAVGIALVAIVLLVFLGHVRAALITAVTIPLALLGAFTGIVFTKTSANLISIGAVDFGIVADSSVIMMENIFRHLGPHGRGSMKQRILAAAHEVGTPMAFSTLIIGSSFIPLFTMTGVSGVIFSPMARTYAFAIGTAILLALTLLPVLAWKLIPANTKEEEPLVMRALHRIYEPIANTFLNHAKFAIPLRIVVLTSCVSLFPLLGGEFMPKLEEGNLWIRATLPKSISLTQSAKYVDHMRAIVRGCPEDTSVPCTRDNQKHPEVIAVTSQLGRPDDGTDVTGFFNIELFAPLTPFDKWKNGLTKEKLTEQLNQELQDAFPGVVFNFSQMIGDNVQEAVAGVKGENSIKIFGPDLNENEKNADAIVETLSRVRGIADLGKFSTLGQPNVKISPDRKACARYGLNSGDVVGVVQTAIGGQAVTQLYEREKAFDVVVRWLPPYRSSLEAIREIQIATPDNLMVPLGQVAKIELIEGPSNIFREDGQRYTPIKFSVRGRDLESAVKEAQEKVNASVPQGYGKRLEWSGEINELREAQRRLLVIIPLTLLLIALLVYAAVKTWLDLLVVLIDIPLACTGALLALLATGTNFSVSAAMGFLSIFGIAIQDAILVVTYFQQMRYKEGIPLRDAARGASEKRFRPVLMTTLVAMLGLMPAALSHGIGAQTQKPLAIAVIGGSFILAMMNRIIQPPLLLVAHEWWEAMRIRKGLSPNPFAREEETEPPSAEPQVPTTAE